MGRLGLVLVVYPVPYESLVVGLVSQMQGIALLLLPLFLLSPGAAWTWDAVEGATGYLVCADTDPMFDPPLACLQITKEFACEGTERCSDRGLLCLDHHLPTTGSMVPKVLTHLGSVFVRVTSALGGGSRDAGIIRDGDTPDVSVPTAGTSGRQYDT